jgi:hypothetical protein
MEKAPNGVELKVEGRNWKSPEAPEALAAVGLSRDSHLALRQRSPQEP